VLAVGRGYGAVNLREHILRRSIMVRAARFWSSLRIRVNPDRGIRWWLIYGPVRSGTSLMYDMVRVAATRGVGDWRIDGLLRLPPEEHKYIRFDRKRALRAVSMNILDNAYFGQGTVLDLVFKQAKLDFEYYSMLVEMWGAPAGKVFCLREPAGYMASTMKKWPDATENGLRSSYIRTLEAYAQIGGRIFEYSCETTREHYATFLAPLVPLSDIVRYGPEVQFRGAQAPDRVTEEVWRAYEKFRIVHSALIFPSPETAGQPR